MLQLKIVSFFQVEKENPKQAVVRKTGPAVQSSVKKDSSRLEPEDQTKLVKKEHLNSIVKEEHSNSIVKEEPSEQKSVIQGKHSNSGEKKEASNSGVKKEQVESKSFLNGVPGKSGSGVKTGASEGEIILVIDPGSGFVFCPLFF